MTKFLDVITKLSTLTNIYLGILLVQLWPFNLPITDSQLILVGIGFILIALDMQREKKQ